MVNHFQGMHHIDLEVYFLYWSRSLGDDNDSISFIILAVIGDVIIVERV